MTDVITRSLVAAAAAAVVLVPIPSAAAEVGASGWWTTAPLLALAPDAQDALLVQGGPQADQPQSYAAVEFALDEAEAASQLRLTVAAGSVTTPSATLTVCPLTSSFAPANGGAMADAPAYDCATKASAAATAGVYTFDVASLTDGGTLALAVLPGAASDRVVLAKPSADALETSGSGSAAGGDATSDGGTATDGDTTFDSGTSFGSDGSPGFSSTPSSPVGSFDAPAIDLPTAVDEAAAPQSPADESPVAIGTAPASTSGDDSGLPVAPIALVLLALLAAGLWATAGRMADETSAT